jgi:hypothetical protein
VGTGPTYGSGEIGELGPVHHDAPWRLRTEVPLRCPIREDDRVAEREPAGFGLLGDVPGKVVTILRGLGKGAAIHSSTLAARKGEPAAAVDFVMTTLDLRHDQALSWMKEDEVRFSVTERRLPIGRCNKPEPVHDHPVIPELT